MSRSFWMFNFIFLCSRFTIIIPRQRQKQIKQVWNHFKLQHIQEQLRNSLQQKLDTENNAHVLQSVPEKKWQKVEKENLIPLFSHFRQNQESWMLQNSDTLCHLCSMYVLVS